MNIFYKLFHKNQIKMENRLIALLTVIAYYEKFEKDTERLKKLKAGVDSATEALTKDIKLPDVKKEEVKDQNKSNLVDKNTPGANLNNKDQQKKPEEEKKKVDEAKKEVKATTAPVINEALLEIAPFYPCTVLAKGAKSAKDVKAFAPRKFKAWKTQADKDQAQGDASYPIVEDLELVFDTAWDMACKGSTNKEILTMCKTELADYYPELKGDSDWYGKLVNPIVAQVQYIKKSFGYKVDDKSVTVTCPREKGLELKADSDCYVTKEEPKKEVKAEEKKPEMKTVQETGKKEEKKAEVKEEKKTEKVDNRVDEEAQEDLDLDLEIDPEDNERDTTVPPAVNKFEEFNDFENVIFEKILEGARIAGKQKDDASKKAAQAENREEVRNLIVANFDGEEWTENTEEGTFNKHVIDYHNSIIREIQANRAKWPK